MEARHTAGFEQLTNHPASVFWNGPLARRMGLLAIPLAAEALLASWLLDGDALTATGAWTRWLHDWGPWGARFAIGFAALFATFAYLKYREALEELGGRLAILPVRTSLLAAHAAAMTAFAFTARSLYDGRTGGASQPISSDALTGIFVALAAVAVISLGLAAAPAFWWRELVRRTEPLWLASAGAAAGACAIGLLSRSLWEPTAHVTFTLVRMLLTPFVHDMIVQPETLRIGTPRFRALIAPECSGLEGIGLLLIFGALFLVIFRDQLRFPRAFLLLPAAVAVLYLLNGVRIAALILIGDAGAEEIAMGGFHSQAGWIAFNSVAFGFSIAARKLAWFSTRPAHPAADAALESSGESPATAAYLMPFLAILAAGMIARAQSGGFEWTYSLRLFAALGALWWFREQYRELDWRADWLAPAAGAAVFVLWIAADRLFSHPQSAMPVPLAAASPPARVLWISLRAAAATVTVPLAEELAFRGYLPRRLVAREFDRVPFERITWLAAAASSLAFGVMHGSRWVEASLAGLLLAWILRRSGRLGNAVIAHSVANALLAGWVLWSGNWALW